LPLLGATCGRPAPDGLEAWRQVIEHGYEGYVVKDGAGMDPGGGARGGGVQQS